MLVQGGSLKIDKNLPEQIQEELKAGRNRYSCSLRIADDKLVANFSYSNSKDYADYEKIFDSFEEFINHAEKFFGIK